MTFLAELFNRKSADAAPIEPEINLYNDFDIRAGDPIGEGWKDMMVDSGMRMAEGGSEVLSRKQEDARRKGEETALDLARDGSAETLEKMREQLMLGGIAFDVEAMNELEERYQSDAATQKRVQDAVMAKRKDLSRHDADQLIQQIFKAVQIANDPDATLEEKAAAEELIVENHEAALAVKQESEANMSLDQRAENAFIDADRSDDAQTLQIDENLIAASDPDQSEPTSQPAFFGPA
ncbi:MAG: hypothetical protein V2I43_23410 [Parvularcula sp.]|jgi:hypothetical protein|nr:hypothetical protein [Parvularcula sp.]